ncbi:hypothetical protein HYPSUDRAFT_1002448 [Hypholoma sublateritium FD-334 SS-4]|uniref:Uncharacterized protein n=1 Tax=Hypholoma sublateritium (strain FD-334 SS-4) TaxID=945553 RepID=A0A0D2NFP2_HYPSF|nr:hypothetical protein HYPSUDRAFT_1002448 [Hypholoma sublateritium FD-334 SS-4]
MRPDASFSIAFALAFAFSQRAIHPPLAPPPRLHHRTAHPRAYTPPSRARAGTDGVHGRTDTYRASRLVSGVECGIARLLDSSQSLEQAIRQPANRRQRYRISTAERHFAGRRASRGHAGGRGAGCSRVCTARPTCTAYLPPAVIPWTSSTTKNACQRPRTDSGARVTRTWRATPRRRHGRVEHRTAPASIVPQHNRRTQPPTAL